jgi:uncharacterized coiled-coil protein SlyX
MKRIFMVVILLTTGIAVFAQQSTRASNRPTSDQTRASARTFLDQSKSNASQFDSTQSSLNTRNISNDDARNFNQLRAEIQRLESQIASEQSRISATLDKGIKVSRDTLDNVQRLMDRHKEKVAELESFTSASGSSR